MGNRFRSNWLRLAFTTLLMTAAIGATGATVAVAQARSGAKTPIAASVRNRLATRAYLEASLSYERAVVAAGPASSEAVEALAGGFGSECPNVAAGIKEMLSAPIVDSQRSARQRRDEARRSRQWDDLTAEVRHTIGLVQRQPYRQAVLTFARKVKRLRWSDQAITIDEHADMQALEWEVDGAALPVCADIEAWVKSGYTTLSPVTRAFAHERALALQPIKRIVDRWPGAVFSNPLLRYEEGRQAKALAQRLAGVTKLGADALQHVYTVSEHIERTLGVVSEAEAKELAEVLRAWKQRISSEQVIASGRGVAGGKYTIWVEPRGQRGPSGSRILEELPVKDSCPLQVDVSEEEAVEGGPLAVAGETGVACLSRSHPMTARVRCENEKRTMEAQTLTGARRVRLTLADGSNILSRVFRVPRRLGGPAGFYYHAQLVWDSPPVSFTELGRHRQPLRTVKLRHLPRCPEQWPYVKRNGGPRSAGG